MKKSQIVQWCHIHASELHFNKMFLKSCLTALYRSAELILSSSKLLQTTSSVPNILIYCQTVKNKCHVDKFDKAIFKKKKSGYWVVK